MIYEPFFNMHVLLTSDAIAALQAVAFFSITFHLFFIAYFVYRSIKAFKKSNLRLSAKV